jgi:protein TonB
VLASSIARGSGHTRLDEEAIATLRRSNPLPAPPSDIAGSQLQLTIPMNFTVPR